jgi:hypothetical protein
MICSVSGFPGAQRLVPVRAAEPKQSDATRKNVTPITISAMPALTLMNTASGQKLQQYAQP